MLEKPTTVDIHDTAGTYVIRLRSRSPMVMFLSATAMDAKSERIMRIFVMVFIANRRFEIGWVKCAKKEKKEKDDAGNRSRR